MITWLFTQVWLWSLAAFVLGAFFSWLLFTRPAKRRLKQVLAREREYYDEGYAAEPAYAEPVYDESAYAEPEYDYEDRRPRIFDDEPEQVEQIREPGIEQHEEPTHQVEPVSTRVEPPAPAPGFDATAVHPWVSPQAAAPIEPVVAEPDTVVNEKPETSGNTWFRRWDEEQIAEAPAAQENTTSADSEQSDLSGQLRSLFAPVEGGNPAGETGYIPPVGADATTVLPKVPEREPEPNRQVTGELNLAEPTREHGERPPRSSPKQPDVPQTPTPHIPEALRQRAEKPKDRSASEPGTGGPANIKPAENLQDAGNLPRRTPGVNPHPGKENGPMIKGHSASRQYHSPDSPAYDQIVADVWFRSAADAEIAGFTPWHGGRR